MDNNLMLQERDKIKKEYSNKIIFLLDGILSNDNFHYVAFREDALIVSKVLEIPLAKFDSIGRVSVSYYDLRDGGISKLIEAGYALAMGEHLAQNR